MTSSVCSFSLLLFIIDLSYYSSFLGNRSFFFFWFPIM
uniref:Uncharacterized protein n=1 Tax=Rhizophora mucronata TaxID=61149 RepID=A0A2P2M7X4_RHIMU